MPCAALETLLVNVMRFALIVSPYLENIQSPEKVGTGFFRYLVLFSY